MPDFSQVLTEIGLHTGIPRVAFTKANDWVQHQGILVSLVWGVKSSWCSSVLPGQDSLFSSCGSMGTVFAPTPESLVGAQEPGPFPELTRSGASTWACAWSVWKWLPVWCPPFLMVCLASWALSLSLRVLIRPVLPRRVPLCHRTRKDVDVGQGGCSLASL